MAAGKKDKIAFNGYIHILPNGTSEIFRQRFYSRFLPAINNSDIYPGSIIFVPSSYSSFEPIEFANTVAPLLSNLTLALASLNSLSN